MASLPPDEILLQHQLAVLIGRGKLPRHLSESLKMTGLWTVVPSSISFKTLWELDMFGFVRIGLLHDMQPTPVVVFAC